MLNFTLKPQILGWKSWILVWRAQIFGWKSWILPWNFKIWGSQLRISFKCVLRSSRPKNAKSAVQNPHFDAEKVNLRLQIPKFYLRTWNFRLKILNFSLKPQILGLPTPFSPQKRSFWVLWGLKMPNLGLKIPILLLKKVNFRPKIWKFYLKASHFMLKTLSFGQNCQILGWKSWFFSLKPPILGLPTPLSLLHSEYLEA